jgi:hypothetical protein
MTKQNNQTLVDALKGTIDVAEEYEFIIRELRKDVTKLRQQFSVMWDVAYEGLERGDDFYAVVEARTGLKRGYLESQRKNTNEDCGDAMTKPQNPPEIAGTFVTIEGAYCKNNLLGYRISTSGVARKLLIFSDQGNMPGVRLGDGFVPDLGESIEYRYVPLAAESEYINKLEALQAKLDRLMLEYCPENMTKEQVKQWGKHQVVFKG